MILSNPLATQLVPRPKGGRLIVFEGIDGCGKGTIIRMLQGRLMREAQGRGQTLMPSFTCAPGGSYLGEQIRNLLFKVPGVKMMDRYAIDALFLASNLQSTTEYITPMLQAGRHVVADRYWQSSVAYSFERHGCAPIPKIHASFDYPRTTTLFLLIGGPRTLVERANARTDGKQQAKNWNDFEMQGRIQNHYLSLFGRRSSTFVVDTTSTSPENLFDNIIWPKICLGGDLLEKHDSTNNVAYEDLDDIRYWLDKQPRRRGPR